MKFAQLAIAMISGVAIAAVSIRSFFKKPHEEHTNPHVDNEANPSSAIVVTAEQIVRKLNWWTTPPPAAWHPVYSAGWEGGYCRFSVETWSPGYDSELACCTRAYSGQTSGYCLSQLPSPPTGSPTDSGGFDFWYPDYDTAWSEAGCSNKRPLPFNKGGRPSYDSQIACCKSAYAGQASGKCISQLPNPPTGSPTESGGLDVYYADYDTPWPLAGCINTRPMPSGRPTYSSMLDCCKGAYAGQTSGKCLSQLPNPPTTSPTESGGLDVYYPDYTRAWSLGVCINTRPLPSGRPPYSTMTACCIGAYGGQTSDSCRCKAQGVCYSCKCGSPEERAASGCNLNCGDPPTTSPPTTSPPTTSPPTTSPPTTSPPTTSPPTTSPPTTSPPTTSPPTTSPPTTISTDGRARI